MNPRYAILLFLLPTAGCIVSTSGGGFGTEVIEDFVIQEAVTELRFDLGAGDFDVQVADVEFVEIHRVVNYFGDRPDPYTTFEDGLLSVGIECGESISCSADFEVLVPANLTLSGLAGSGDVYAVGPFLDVDLETGSGDVSLSCATGSVFLQTGSGDIAGSCIAAGELFAITGSGDVALELSEVPTFVGVTTGSGDVELLVPHAAYAVVLQTGSGHTQVDGIELDSGSAHRIEVETGSGDIVVLGH